MLGPLGLVSLGSNTVDGFKDYAPGSMQGARFESGLDNSPMRPPSIFELAISWSRARPAHQKVDRSHLAARYDGDFYNKSVVQDGSMLVGQMTLYDVGFASMFVQDAEALATLATAIGRTADAQRLKARAAAQRALISAHLWDDQGGIFTNKFWFGT